MYERGGSLAVGRVGRNDEKCWPIWPKRLEVLADLAEETSSVGRVDRMPVSVGRVDRKVGNR